MSKNIIIGKQALRRVKNGVNKLADAVKVTLGPSGRLVIIKKGFGGPHVTKDGYTVADSIVLEDSAENQACELVKQVSKNTADKAGDGTTTSLVIIQSLFNILYSYIIKTHIEKPSSRRFSSIFTNLFSDSYTRKYNDSEDNLSVPELIRGVEDGGKLAIKYLNGMSKKVKKKSDVKNIAMISSNGDDILSGLISDAVEKLGNNALITRDPDPSTVGKDILTIKSGYSVEKGYASPTFGDPKENGKVELTDPIFFLKAGEINDFSEVLPFLEISNITKKSLIIIAHKISDIVLGYIIKNHLNPGTPKINVIFTPGMPHVRDYYIKDIKHLINYEFDIFNPPKKIDNIKSLGRCELITSTRTDTSIIVSKEISSSEEFNNYINKLEKSISPDMPSHMVENIKNRVSKLRGKAGTISLYARTDGELKEKIDRLDDAIEATKSVLEEGYVPGGGITFLRISEKLKKDYEIIKKEGKSYSYLCGFMSIIKTGEAPIKTLFHNAGYNEDEIKGFINKLSKNNVININKNSSDIDRYGYDLRSEEFCDLIKKGVIDPAKVLRIAIDTAISTSRNLISTGCIIS